MTNLPKWKLFCCLELIFSTMSLYTNSFPWRGSTQKYFSSSENNSDFLGSLSTPKKKYGELMVAKKLREFLIIIILLGDVH